MLPEGTTFVFGSWVCVANGAGGFCRHIVNNTIKPKALASRLDEFVDNRDELPFFDSAREIEADSVTTIPFSALEKDLDSLLQAGSSDATACHLWVDDHHHLRRTNRSLEGDGSV
jgi:uridine kinase